MDLFNTTDRGSIKNLHIINNRKNELLDAIIDIPERRKYRG